MTTINLTPHEITLVRDGSTIAVLPPSGRVARVEIRRIETSAVVTNGVSFPVFESVLGPAIDLPEHEGETTLIVSQMVAAACPSRRDLVFPDQLVRDEAGRVIGCASFGQVQP